MKEEKGYQETASLPPGDQEFMAKHRVNTRPLPFLTAPLPFLTAPGKGTGGGEGGLIVRLPARSLHRKELHRFCKQTHENLPLERV